MTHLPAALRRRIVLLVTAFSAATISSSAQTDVHRLDPYITTATRTSADPRTVGTHMDLLLPSELEDRQLGSLREAVGSIGVPLLSSGAPGGATSLFLRGSNSNQTLFLVDGIRFNDPNTEYFVTLGGACVSACDSLEIAHGPQSTLYGGEAIGGVVSIRAEPGRGTPESRLAVEAGSFGTIQARALSRGERGGWAYNSSLQGGHTDNERPNNAFDSFNAVARVDRTLKDGLSVGGTVRWFHGVYGSPGSRFTNDPDNEEREDNVLSTLFARYVVSPELESRVTLGGQDRRYVSHNPSSSGSTQITVVKNRRGVLDWQGTYRGLPRHRVTGGLTTELNHTRNTGFGNINKRQQLLAFFAQDEYAALDNLHFTAGLRSDDFDTFGRATTGRGSIAWLPVPQRLKLRASYGTAFRSPSFLDLYGESGFYRGNSHLRSERAKGWDGGVDYYFRQPGHSLSLTWFETRYRDLIVFKFNVFPSTTENVERAETRGLELSYRGALPGSVQTRLAYNYLEARNLTLNTRLLRRPRHGGSIDLWREFGRSVALGIGARSVRDREDVNAQSFGPIDGENYSLLRLFGSWRINDRFTLKGRVENALDEDYEEVHGYPQLGMGAFASIEWRF